MRVFRVTAFRTRVFTIEAFVRALSAEHAEEVFFAALEGEGCALRWVEDCDSSDTDIETIEDVTRDHEPEPAGHPPACVLCARPVRWTGVPAADAPHGRTIPGPWIHAPNPIVDEGVGL